ncbi:MAG: putative deoxyribonuclease YcfH [Alphaproteobacteria bacterium ADurb.Bin438]|nr:MAG: putative deoxyribonuclease YcfH [Alphaproteobacteria bacterium ADurb.Bin438]
MIDSHVHLESFENLDEIILNATSNNVEKMLTVSTSFDDFEKNIVIAHNNDQVYTTMGIHPEYADKYVGFDEDAFIKNAKKNKVVAIGEIGLDYYYDSAKKENQIMVFTKQLEIALALNLPIIIHSRDADDDMIRILSKYKGKIKGVMHCFSSGFDLAQFALEIGFYVSASGIITFKKSFALRDIFKTIPLDRLLIETDAPYLAPHPFRGKQNEPALIPYTLKCLAEIKEIDVKDMENITTKNFYDLFSGVQK